MRRVQVMWKEINIDKPGMVIRNKARGVSSKREGPGEKEKVVGDATISNRR